MSFRFSRYFEVKIVFCLVFSFIIGSVLILPCCAATVNIIFDTDMDTDCDDVGAIAILHVLADRGEANILATMVSSKYEWSVPCLDAINTYFGRAYLPIGVVKGPGAPTDRGSRYTKQIADRFPHDLTADKAPDAVELYRQILSSEPDRSVVIVTVGYLTNLSNLLKSKPDRYSPLTGKELVAKKVEHYVCMGSRYPIEDNPGIWGNFKPDPAAVVHVAAEWPTKITFTGGGKFAEDLATGARLATQVPVDSPVRCAYELYFGGTSKKRHSADQIAVLVAVRGTGKPWKLVTEGYNHIFPNGNHEWGVTPNDPRHQYISALADGVQPSHVAKVIEDLMVTPPKGRGQKDGILE
jgi:hypothetical protein